MDKYTQRLDSIVSNFQNDVRLLAEEICKEVLIPFCKKYNMTFNANYDLWSFCWRGAPPNDFVVIDENSWGYLDLPEDMEKEMIPIIDLLLCEVYRCERLSNVINDNDLCELVEGKEL